MTLELGHALIYLYCNMFFVALEIHFATKPIYILKSIVPTLMIVYLLLSCVVTVMIINRESKYVAKSSHLVSNLPSLRFEVSNESILILK